MPIFHAYIPAGKFSSAEKHGLADALNLALHESMETPMDDRFVVISEHREEELFIHPTFPAQQRSDRRLIVTVTFGDSRTTEQKRKLADLVTRYAVEKGPHQPGRHKSADVRYPSREHELWWRKIVVGY